MKQKNRDAFLGHCDEHADELWQLERTREIGLARLLVIIAGITVALLLALVVVWVR